MMPGVAEGDCSDGQAGHGDVRAMACVGRAESVRAGVPWLLGRRRKSDGWALARAV